MATERRRWSVTGPRQELNHKVHKRKPRTNQQGGCIRWMHENGWVALSSLNEATENGLFNLLSDRNWPHQQTQPASRLGLN